MIGCFLLDANALIALVVSEHEHHDRVAAWSKTVEKVALCPITEGAMVRYLVRVGEDPLTAENVLLGLHKSPRVEFWSDSISYVDVVLDHITGHRQVTDTYLAALAKSHVARVATFDGGLVAALPHEAELIP